MRKTVAALAGAVALAHGCGGTPSLERDEALAGACQFRPCVCADADAPFWQVPETTPIIWSRTGGAPACPLGFVLRPSEEE